MTDVTELERRITAALDRISQSAETLSAGSSESSPDLLEDLEIERATNARLAEAGQQNLARIERLETRLARLNDRLEFVEIENKRLQAVADTMRDANVAMREAYTSGAADPEAFNLALQAENDALRAARAADLAEMDEILGDLAPLVKEA